MVFNLHFNNFRTWICRAINNHYIWGESFEDRTLSTWDSIVLALLGNISVGSFKVWISCNASWQQILLLILYRLAPSFKLYSSDSGDRAITKHFSPWVLVYDRFKWILRHKNCTHLEPSDLDNVTMMGRVWLGTNLGQKMKAHCQLHTLNTNVILKIPGVKNYLDKIESLNIYLNPC